MKLIEINRNPSSRELRQFAGIWLPLLMSIVGWVLLRRTGSWNLAVAIWGTAVVIAVAGFVRPSIVRPLLVGWMIAVYPIGVTVFTVILAIIYFVVMTPIGILMKLVGHDPLSRQAGRSAGTYWIRHNPGGDTERYFRQY